MTTDKELLEYAAKAAGLSVVRIRLDDPFFRDMLLPAEEGQGVGWNPLTDDGDAFRLMVKLQLDSQFGRPFGKVNVDEITETWSGMDQQPPDYAPVFVKGRCAYAATRRAIVRAAAEVGKRMTEEETRDR
jgi:hypothetical protein